MGLSLREARTVADGKADLNVILRRMAIQERADKLMEKHGIVRSLAVQVALGQADLDQVLARRRMDSYLEERGAHTIFDAAAASGKPVCLALHGRRNVQVRVVKNDKYEIDVEDAESGAPERIHKLMVKLAWRPEDRKAVRKVMSWDKERSKGDIQPIMRPQDRFHVSDRKLFTCMEGGVRLQITTLEGEQVAGRVTWLSEFEFGLELKGGVEVVVLRHAVADLKEQAKA